MFEAFKKKFENYTSHDLGIDLGTTSTLIYVKGKGIVVNEPTVVAVNNKTNQIVEIGERARSMIGRTPNHLRTVKPITNGVISDFEFAQEFMSHLVRRAEEKVGKKMAGPTMVIGAPAAITNVERRAIRHAARSAGARRVFLVEEPMLAAIGVHLPIHDPVGNLVVDIGGGTTDIALISLGGIVMSRHTTIAGERFDQDIVDYIRETFKVLIGERTAENLKRTTASIYPTETETELVVRGRDLVTGLPRELLITGSDLREALLPSITLLAKEIKDVLETAPPEIASDVLSRGLVLVGGGALLVGLPQFLEDLLQIHVFTPDDPLTSVVNGTSRILEDLESFENAFIIDE